MTMPESHDHELIDGRLVEQSPMGAESSYVALRLAGRLINFIDDHPIGWGRLEDEKIPLGYVNIPPDLAVEVISPNDLAYEVVSKLDQYQRAGIPLIWVIYPNTRTVEILRSNGTRAGMGEDEQLSGEDVIPGFSVRVSALFPPRENVNEWPEKEDD